MESHGQVRELERKEITVMWKSVKIESSHSDVHQDSPVTPYGRI